MGTTFNFTSLSVVIDSGTSQIKLFTEFSFDIDSAEITNASLTWNGLANSGSLAQLTNLTISINGSGTSGYATALLDPAFYPNFYKQSTYQRHNVNLVVVPSPTGIITLNQYYIYTIATDSNNLLLNNGRQRVSVIDLGANSKTLILPPLTQSVGMIHYFKIKNYINPYSIMISPYLKNLSYPLTTTITQIAGSTPSSVYDSTIEDSTYPILLNAENYAFSIISNGTNWNILSSYSNELAASISNPTITPGDDTQEPYSSEVVYYQYVDKNLYLFGLANTIIKNIIIKNTTVNMTDISIDLPNGSNIEGSSGTRITFSSIPENGIFSLILTYVNGTYYILGFMRSDQSPFSSYISYIQDRNPSGSAAALVAGINTQQSGSSTTDGIVLAASPINSTVKIYYLKLLDTAPATFSLYTPSGQTDAYFLTNTGDNDREGFIITKTPTTNIAVKIASVYNSSVGTIILPLYIYSP
jgi:hypothetical protein